MTGTNDSGKGRTILKAILPFLALLFALAFVYILWHYYHPNREINIHQTHVSRQFHGSNCADKEPPVSA